jgi:Ca-activated chloride channel family protein
VSFERPWLLLALLVVPAAVALYLLAERRRMRYAIRFTNVDVLAGVLRGRLWRQYLPAALFLLAIAALCVGVARPQRTTLVPKDRATVILVVDVSRSMEAKDVKPSRIGAATAAVRLFLDKVPDRVQVGLIAFAGDPAVAAPPTTDHDLVREALGTLQWYPSFGGTAIGDALAEAVRLGQQAVGGGNGNLASVTAAPSGKTRGLVSILFLSDGAQTRGELLPLDGAERACVSASTARRRAFPVGSARADGCRSRPIPTRSGRSRTARAASSLSRVTRSRSIRPIRSSARGSPGSRARRKSRTASSPVPRRC